MPKTSLTPRKVADLVEKYLEVHQPAGYRILIQRKEVREDSEGWWHVSIQPSRTDVPTYDWIGRSAEAAVDLDEAEGVHVLFV